MSAQTIFFATNIQFLRRRNRLSQEDIAAQMGITRSTVNNYENAYAEPGLRVLSGYAKQFQMSVDTLLHVDISKLSEMQLRDLETGNDVFIRGTKLRILATTVDSNNRENIELVPLRAKAGYTAGYNDSEFIRTLPTFQLPFLSSERKYRTFQLSGDSMLPIPDKAYVVGEFVENWNDMKDGQAYVILTRDEGIVFKIVFLQAGKKKKILLKSLNANYEPYEMPLSEVQEVWKFVNYISHELPDAVEEKENLMESVTRISAEAERIAKLLAEQNNVKVLKKSAKKVN